MRDTLLPGFIPRCVLPHRRLSCDPRRLMCEPMSEPKDQPVRPDEQTPPKPAAPPAMPKEIGGPKGPEPTRHGDWEYNGRCTDF
jgi:hypothetical protein